MKFKMLVLKTRKLSDFSKRGSKLFHSIMEKKVSEKSCGMYLERGRYAYFKSSITSFWKESS